MTNKWVSFRNIDILFIDHNQHLGMDPHTPVRPVENFSSQNEIPHFEAPSEVKNDHADFEEEIPNKNK